MDNNVLKNISDLKRKAYSYIEDNKLEKAQAMIAAISYILYHWNQIYVDDDLEKCIHILSHKFFSSSCNYISQNKVVLFYDAFGLNTRGLACIYLKALVENGYKIVYLAPKNAEDDQDAIYSILSKGDSITIYFSPQSYTFKIKTIENAVKSYKPKYAFLYSKPDDVAACVAFDHLKGACIRYKINLTDDAFWLGRDCFDYCIEFRDVGANISAKYRKIPKTKLIKLPFYPYINDSSFEGFPFSEDKKVIFSGGSLYKTLGDRNNTFYRIVEGLLNKHNDTVFLYAGNGDDSELIHLQKKLPERIYHINERTDLFQVMKHSTIYLNTYPIVGGLMMQYAAIAGRPPLTYRSKESDLDIQGILLNDNSVIFDSIESLEAEADKLLDDAEYRKQREYNIKNTVISSDEFNKQLRRLLERQSTGFIIRFDDIEIDAYQESYIERFDYETVLEKAIANRENMTLFFYYPHLFMRRIIKKLFSKLKF